MTTTPTFALLTLDPAISDLDELAPRQEQHSPGQLVTVRRWQHPGSAGLVNPGHVSLVTDPGGTVFGFTDLAHPARSLPSRRHAEEAARELFTGLDPSHAQGLTVLWVEPHEEIVDLPTGTATITGMKVKTHHTNGLYTWAIVDDHRVITYERDIAWDSERSRRLTPMWLHNDWIAAHDGVGPQPPAPKALI